MKNRVMRTALLAGLSFWLYACGGTGEKGSPEIDGGTDPAGSPDTGGGVSIAWGPRLDSTSDLSPVHGAEDAFGPGVAGAVMRAARAAPNGATQSSLVEDGRTADEVSVDVVRNDDGNLAHEVTDGARWTVRVPNIVPGAPRPGFDLALFTGLIPGIEPDLSSYPHELLGMWAWEPEEEGTLEVGAFWSKSPEIPAVEFGDRSPAGTATYDGDAVGLHTAGGATTKFLADVEMVADFDDHTVGGEVDGFRSLTGAVLDIPAVGLGETGFSPRGEPFAGGTTLSGVAGGGQWGARWSDGEGWTMGGTFGFAADDDSVGVLGAFSASGEASRPVPGSGPDEPAAGAPTPTPEAIQAALDSVIESADTEMFSFGGDVAVCLALSCPQAGRIYVRSGRTSAVADTSGFEFTETRGGMSLAEKDGESRHGLGTTRYRSLAGWMDHGFFLVTVGESSVQGSTLVDYDILAIGDSTGTTPSAPAVGSATWSGTMVGFVESAASGDDGSFVDGDARITLPGIAAGAAATVDVLFSNVIGRETGARRADMAWDGVRLTDGAFGSPKVIAPILASDVDISAKAIETGIYGRFHGPGHEEVGGVFRRDGITGAFGATRDRTP